MNTRNKKPSATNSQGNIPERNLIMGVNSKILFALISFLLITMVFTTFRGAFDNEFVDWDDYTYVVENDLVRNVEETSLKDVFSQLVSLNYHPLTILSLRLNNNECEDCMEGISAAPFIKWNLTIHILNTLLVFFLVYLLSKKKILAAFLAAAIFGVHPMHVESVVWISERKDVLYTFFFLLSVLAFVRFESLERSNKSKWAWFALTFFLFILSCLSKAMAVVFPLVLILIKFWMFEPKGNSPIKETVKEIFSSKFILFLIPFFLFSLFWGIFAISVNSLNTFSLWHRIQFACYGFIMYMVKFLVPLNLSAIYPYPTLAQYESGTIGTILQFAPFLFITIAGVVIYSLRKTKLFVFGIGFFIVTVMMVSQFISVGVAIMADRYAYVCYIGLAFIPAMLIGNQINKKRIPLYLLAFSFLLLLMSLSKKQTEIWSNSETLWTRVIELYPELEAPRSIRGLYYRKRAELTEDEKEKILFEQKAFDDFKFAIKAGTKKADVFEGAGCLYGKYGDYNNALEFLNKAIEMKPQKGSAYYNRGLVYSMLSQNDKAISDYNTSLFYQPEKALQIINNRSNLLMATGRFKEAIKDYDYLISLGGNNYIYFYNRALAKEKTFDIDGAETDYLKALRLNPDDELSREQLKKLFPDK